MKVLIFTSRIENFDKVKLNLKSFDGVISADGGYKYAEIAGIEPDLYIGDYDSSPLPKDKSCIILPCEKDVTDSEAAIDLAIEKGFDDITVLGGLGGRFDHTMGNIGLLRKYLGKTRHMAFLDGNNYVFMLQPGSYTIPKNNFKYLGLISYECTISKLSVSGTKYTLDNYDLGNATTLGVSNEITGESAKISFDDGILLVILSNEAWNK